MPASVIGEEEPIVTPPPPAKLPFKLMPAEPLNVIAPVEVIFAAIVAVPELVSSKVPAELIAPVFVKVVEVISILPEAVVMAAVEIAAPFNVNPVSPLTAPPIVIFPATGMEVSLEVSMLKV